MLSCFQRLAAAAIVVLPAILQVGVAGAQAPPAPMTISVAAEGVSTTAPNFVVVKGVVPGRGDSSVAAHKAFEAAKTALEKEFPPGGPHAQISFQGERFATPNAGMEGVVMAIPAGGAAVEAPKQTTEVSEKIELRLPIGSEMERAQVAQRIAFVLDKAAKVGIEFAKPINVYTVSGRQGSAVAEFGIDDPKKASLAASEAAVRAAREKADALAAAAGGVITGVVAIEEIGPDKDPSDAYTTILMLSTGETPPGSEFSVDTNREIEIRRKLRVVFSWVPK